MEFSERPPHLYRSHRDHPSFSSTLLDQIYRSIDESDGCDFTRRKEDEYDRYMAINYRGSGKKKLHGSLSTEKDHVMAEDERKRRSRARDAAAVGHRRSVAADFAKSRPRNGSDCSSSSSSVFFKHSCSSSSDSSSGGVFSSSESESFNGRSRSSRSPPDRAMWTAHPKPIRTSVAESCHASKSGSNKQEELGSFLRTKSKALKIYSELKKAKQPISPGGRLASFLNSIFAAGPAKKMKKTTTKTAASSAAAGGTTSACSSASSFSRSCLSKTPSSFSSGKSKRSVTFSLHGEPRPLPPCSTKSVHENRVIDRISDSINERELEIRVMEENRRAVEASKELLESYRRKKKDKIEIFRAANVISFDEDEDEDEDDDDAASCASSDLFELENLSAIGIERYREELPVYKSTRIGTNRAIVNSGLVL